MIQIYLGVSATVTNAVRLGSKGAKPRLLKISVGSIQEKLLILKNCTKLWNKEFPDSIQKIYIAPDLTPKEQQENKALRPLSCEVHNNHWWLDPYFLDNGSISRKKDASLLTMLKKGMRRMVYMLFNQLFMSLKILFI